MSTFEETEASPMQVDPAVVSQTTLEDLQKHLQQANSQNEVLRLHISSLEEEVNNLREDNEQLKVKVDLTDIKTDMKTREQMILKDEEILTLKARIAQLEHEAQQGKMPDGLNVPQAQDLTMMGVDAAAAVAAALDVSTTAAPEASTNNIAASVPTAPAVDENFAMDDDNESQPTNQLMSTSATSLGSRSDEKWEQHFQRLVVYHKTHQNCLVPTSTELGRWLCRQRHNNRYKGLKEERRIRLMELDSTCLGEVVTTVDPNQQSSSDGKVAANGEGGEVLNVKTVITPAKTKYNRAYESKLHQKWDQYFQQLVVYKEKHGHCNFPTMNGSLGRWISRQRTLYRSKKLKKDREEKLAELGFAFEDATALEFKGKLDEQWDTMFNNLAEHKKKNGHCFNVPEHESLGKWLYRQRWLYRHGNLREDRAEKLLGIGFEDKKNLKKDTPTSKRKGKKRKSSPLTPYNNIVAGDTDEKKQKVENNDDSKEAAKVQQDEVVV